MCQTRRKTAPCQLLPLLLALLAPGAAAAAEAPDPQALLAEAKEAAGGAAWDRVRSVRVEADVATAGLEGTAVSLSDVVTGRSVSRYDLGVAQGASGFDGRAAWEQDASGDVVAQDSLSQVEASRTEAYRTALAYWYPERWPAEIRYERREADEGRSYHVLWIHPDGGRPFEMWLDADTSLIARTVERGATTTTTTLLSDYRDVDGALIPFRSSSTRGEPGSEVEVTVTAVELNAETTDAAFAPPEVRVDDFTIAGDQTSLTVPFELLNNHIYVMASVNGSREQRFLVDTGGLNLVTRKAADDLGIASEGAFHVSGTGEGSAQAGVTRLDNFRLGEVTFRQPVFAVIPLDGVVSAEGVEFAGLVGFEVFRRFVVTIDYAASRLTLTRPEAFHYQGTGVSVPFRYEGRTPVVEGSLDGLAGSFSIDTGSRSTLDLHRPFVAEHDLVARYEPPIEAISGWGVGGGVRSRVSRADKLTLGEMEVPGVVLELTAQERGSYTDRYVAGNVGGGVLKRFTVIFDYANQRMILERNRDFDRPDAFDRSGMWINQVAAGFQVEDVVTGGPAAAAGLAVGERVVAVDGRPASEVLLPKLRQRFRTEAPGTEILLTVEGGTERREVRLVLRDLV